MKKIKKTCMYSLLGVGMGSVEDLILLRWRRRKVAKPLAFVGKGVLLIRWLLIKTRKIYGGCTYAMAGSAAVVGLMKTLAIRKAKINAVGVVGQLKIWLVEKLKDRATS